VLDTEQAFAVLVAIGIVIGKGQDWLDARLARAHSF
jgi:hypothetical protein